MVSEASTHPLKEAFDVELLGCSLGALGRRFETLFDADILVGMKRSQNSGGDDESFDCVHR